MKYLEQRKRKKQEEKEKNEQKRLNLYSERIEQRNKMHEDYIEKINEKNNKRIANEYKYITDKINNIKKRRLSFFKKVERNRQINNNLQLKRYNQLINYEQNSIDKYIKRYNNIELTRNAVSTKNINIQIALFNNLSAFNKEFQKIKNHSIYKLSPQQKNIEYYKIKKKLLADNKK